MRANLKEKEAKIIFGQKALTLRYYYYNCRASTSRGMFCTLQFLACTVPCSHNWYNCYTAYLWALKAFLIFETPIFRLDITIKVGDNGIDLNRSQSTK